MNSLFTGADEQWMRHALKLARRGEGLTRPNPPVGAVVVRQGKVVGEGWHRCAGDRHAEDLALRRAGEQARGATLYVTLEPCCTWGRRPPCTEAILAAGVSRVVAGVRDPNPRHRGRGLRQLAHAGVEVREGVCHAEAAALIEPFSRWVTRGRPWVTLKLAITLDGRIADAAGASRWITGLAARREVHSLRRRVDAILVGRHTVERDDPSLLPRPDGGRRPWRIVVSRTGAVPATAQLLHDDAVSRTLIAVSSRCSLAHERALRRSGADVIRLPEAAGGVDLSVLMLALGDRGFLHVLCEGGGKLAGALAHAELVDEYYFFVAPKLIGATGRPAIGADWTLADAPSLKWMEMRKMGGDLLVRARPGPRTRRPSLNDVQHSTS